MHPRCYYRFIKTFPGYQVADLICVINQLIDLICDINQVVDMVCAINQIADLICAVNQVVDLIYAINHYLFLIALLAWVLGYHSVYQKVICFNATRS